MSCKLWRSELIEAVVEVSEQVTVVKADMASSLIFGLPSHSMQKLRLSR